MKTLKTKVCTKCGVRKNISRFYARKRAASGLCPSCKDCCKAYDQSPSGQSAHRRYYHSKKEVILPKVRAYKTTENGRAAQKRYDQSEKGRISSQQISRRHNERKRGLDMKFSDEDARTVYRLFDNKCANCGSGKHLHIDHHYPLSKGYGLVIGNAVLLCKSCNSSKCDKLPAEFYTPERLKYIDEKIK